MTEPTPLTAEQFLPFAEAAAIRDDQATRLACPWPNCPTCQQSVDALSVSDGIHFCEDITLFRLKPCGHRFTATGDIAHNVLWRTPQADDSSATAALPGPLRFDASALDDVVLPDDAVEIFLMRKPKPEFVLQLREDDGTLTLGIRPDGSIERGPRYDPDTAAREFWDALSRAARAASPFGGGQ